MLTRCLIILLAAGATVQAFHREPECGDECLLTSHKEDIQKNSKKELLVQKIDNKTHAIYNKTYTGFRNKTKEIEFNRNESKRILGEEFASVELTVDLKKANEVAKLINNGSKINDTMNCLMKVQNNFTKDKKKEHKKIEKCIENATKEAKEKVDAARNNFTNITLGLAEQGRGVTTSLLACVTLMDDNCEKKNWKSVEKVIKDIGNCSTEQLDKIQNVSVNQQTKIDQVCMKNIEKILENFQSKHNNITEECIKDPKTIPIKENEKEEEEEEEKTNDKKKPTLAVSLEYDYDYT